MRVAIGDDAADCSNDLPPVLGSGQTGTQRRGHSELWGEVSVGVRIHLDEHLSR